MKPKALGVIIILIVMMAAVIALTAATSEEYIPEEETATSESDIVIIETPYLKVSSRKIKDDGTSKRADERHVLDEVNNSACESLSVTESTYETQAFIVYEEYVHEATVAFYETVVETQAAIYETVMETVIETQWVQETTTQTQPAAIEVEPMDYLHELLMVSLENAGIGWWYPYACAVVTQESHWNPNAVSADGMDYGLFQFRLMYWNQPESIFDVNAQIRVYVTNTSARISAGLSIEEVISRHNTSDYVTEINWKYVQDVLQHLH